MSTEDIASVLSPWAAPRYAQRRGRGRDYAIVPSCRDAAELVTEYLEGALAPGEREWFEAHVTTCPSCRRYLRQMRLTIHVLHHLPRPTLSDEAMADLLGAFAWAGRPT